MNDAIRALVRRHDPDRFLTALFAPPDRRDALLALYAFNHELARAREVVSEAPLALIRLQWWREVVEGARRRHEVADPLAAVLEAGLLRPSDLLPVIEARETEAEAPPDTLEDWRRWLLAGAGGLAVAAARLLGAVEPDVVRPYGAAYGAAGVLRNVVVLAAMGRCQLPLDLLAASDLSPEAAVADLGAPSVQAVLRQLALEGQAWLRAAGPVPRIAIPAALPAVLARRDLARWPPVARQRGLGDRLAVTWAGLRGRV
jgi:phytoene synthase